MNIITDLLEGKCTCKFCIKSGSFWETLLISTSFDQHCVSLKVETYKPCGDTSHNSKVKKQRMVNFPIHDLTNLTATFLFI